MTKNKRSNTPLASISVAILPAIIAALAGVVGAYFSYSAGVDAIRIPLMATQTAEAKHTPITAVTQINGQPNVAIAVDSTKTWQPTGIFVTKGDTINIRVVGGKWTTWREKISDNLRAKLPNNEDAKTAEIWINWHLERNGSGSSNAICVDDNCPLPDQSLGLLVARIDNTTYIVGTTCSFLATETGQIFLQINDYFFSDNGGILAVEVNSDRFDTFPTSAGCGAAYSK